MFVHKFTTPVVTVKIYFKIFLLLDYECVLSLLESLLCGLFKLFVLLKINVVETSRC